MTAIQWFVVAGIAWTALLLVVWCLLVVASKADAAAERAARPYDREREEYLTDLQAGTWRGGDR